MTIRHLLPGLALLLLTGLPQTGHAAREIEPNNTPEQATLVDPSQPIEGVIQDQVDFYKIVLPAEGRVNLQLEGYPVGTRVILGVNGFQESGSAPLVEKQGGELASLRLHFDARERAGLVWVKFVFSETACQDLWCAARLTADGPWYTTRTSPLAPAQWQGTEVVEAPTYQLRISQAGRTPADKTTARNTGRPGYQHFKDDASGLSFAYPATWQVSPAAQPQHWELQTIDSRLSGRMKIDLELRLRRDYPGSSAARQLNLAERDLTSRNAEIRKQGLLEAAGQQAPYLVAVFPPPGTTDQEGETARMQVIVPLPDHYCWVGYSGPGADYAGSIKVLENLLQTLQLQPPAPTATPKAPENKPE